MKLQLDEKTLNAYINEAIKYELAENNTDELLGSRVRKQSRRMITGKGWGNQKRSQNGFMAANNDISATDADEVVPQTLVGMIKQMDKGLATIEQFAGLNGQYEGLGEKVAAYRNGGGFKMKQSLLNAINALGRLADRLSAVERTSGSNAIMESAGDYMDATVGGNAAIGVGKATGEKATAAQNLATRQAAYNKALNRFDAKPTNLNLNRGIGKEKAFIAAQNAAKTEQQAIYKAAQEYSKVLQSSGRQLSKGGQVIGNTPEAIIKHYTNPNGAFDYKRFVSSIERNAPVQLKNNAELKNAVSGLNSVKPTGGFWAGQARNVQKGIEGVRKGSQTIKGAGEYGRYVSTLAKGAGKGTGVARAAGAAKTTGQVLKGAGQIAKGVGQITQIPMLLLTIADEAARQGAEARQRKIVRTYNCASVLAKRMANIAQEIADAQGGQEEAQELQEINVRRAKKSFGSIEQGMNQLSAIMKQINAEVNGQHGGQTEMPQSLNTRQEIQQFQNWANEHGYKDQDGQPLNPDGIWGRRTAYVYDQIAQQQGGGQINESNAVMSALTDLENKVGSTGSGGRAYSDISRMSGGGNGSRSQNARAAKFIIRTYPPVLNQYLEVLGIAGANVNGLQPLKVDNRPNRDYDASEVTEIDTRIKQLLNIAQNLDGVKPNDKPVKLPPKPIIKPKPVKQDKPAPVEPEEKPTRPEMPKLEPVKGIDLPTQVTLPQDKQPGIVGRPEVQPTFPQNVASTMIKTATADPSVASQREKNRGMRQMRNNALDAISRDSYTGNKKEDSKFVNDMYRTIRRGNQHPSLEESKKRVKITESEFKKLVKKTITEFLKK